MRTEQDVFEDLASLCVSEGFIHALATICFRDSLVGFRDELSASDLVGVRSRSRLIRSEITMLIGLAMRGPISFSIPDPDTLAKYIKQSECLLGELHRTMMPLFQENGELAGLKDLGADEFTSGRFLREAIFYGGESAYPFQYRDFAFSKYHHDSTWLRKNRGIRLETCRSICRGIVDILNDRAVKTQNEFSSETSTLLPGFMFSCDEISRNVDQPVDEIRAFVEAFCLPEDERNSAFTSMNAFNAAYAYPIVRHESDAFILLQQYGLSEALYEAPFYWMCEDESYRSTALSHRGEFAETLSAERLSTVFGPHRVFKNVEIFRSKGKILGEVDVLAIFGDRIVVVQAKSKRLTLEARKGNDGALRDDFKSAVQDAVDQSYRCAELLCDKTVTLRCRDGRHVELRTAPRTIFPVAIVSDHYPALAFQARQFLKVRATDEIVPPLVVDVFAVDAITEFLSSPLRFLSYLDLRVRHSERTLASHEHMILSYHLKRNLWFENDLDLVMFDDDVSSDLDVAMAVRREGIPGSDMPDGILTRFENTHFARILSDLEGRENPVAINLGFMLLELGEETIRKLNEGIQKLMNRFEQDGRHHDLVIGISEASTGLTVHCTGEPHQLVEPSLRGHCEFRKYMERANSWYGLSINQAGAIQIVVELAGNWKEDPAMEQEVQELVKHGPVRRMGKRKIGRNDRCPCGSGRMYKHCCLNR